LVLGAEVGGGLWAHSLALLSDAGHITADALALGLAWVAAVQSRRPADRRRTYGYHRINFLAALANAVLLLAIVAAIGFEAIQRLLHPQLVLGQVVIVTAAMAVTVNAGAALVLHRRESTPNLRAAFLHVVGDLAASIGVLVSGAIVATTGWGYADPSISLAIALLIAVGAIHIIREVVNVLLEGAPHGMDLVAVEQELLAGPGVLSIHDPHVWTVSPDHAALSAHLVVDAQSLAAGERLIRALESRLCRKFGIGHTTLQLEASQPCPDGCGHGPAEHNHPHRPQPTAS
jgi:cobalt-zinc-cadmium efflux system protein